MGNKEAFDEYFKFKVGDLVVSRSTVEGELLARDMGEHEFSGPKIPMPEVIIGRVLEECHGGFQGFYLVRRYTDRNEILGKLGPGEVMSVAELKLAYAEIVEGVRQRAAEKPGSPSWRKTTAWLTGEIAAIKAQLDQDKK